MGANRMTDFSVTSAATEGFQVMKSKPLAVAAWLGAYAVAAALIIGLIAAIVGFTAFANFPALMQAAANDTRPDPGVLASLVSALVTTMIIVAVVSVVVESVIITAVKRAVLRPEESGFFYMRLGGDEFRTFLVLLVKGLIFFAVALAFGVIGFLLALVHKALIALVVLACIPAFIYVAVKLSLSVSQSFAERRFNMLGSWSLTRGHFWELVGAYVLAFIFYMIAYFVLSTIGGLAGGNALMAEMMKDPENVDWAAMGSLMGAGMMVNIVVGIILKGIEFPVLGAPPAAAYRDLTLDPIA